MLKSIRTLALMMAAGFMVGQAMADDVVYDGQQSRQQMTAANRAPAATQRPTARRAYSAPPVLPWPAYANYGNPVASSYSRASGLRSGQVFGTFGNRPADSRARGSY